MHACICTHVRTHAHCACIHTYTCICTHVCTLTHTHLRAHARTHTHTRTHDSKLALPGTLSPLAKTKTAPEIGWGIKTQTHAFVFFRPKGTFCPSVSMGMNRHAVSCREGPTSHPPHSPKERAPSTPAHFVSACLKEGIPCPGTRQVSSLLLRRWLETHTHTHTIPPPPRSPIPALPQFRTRSLKSLHTGV